MVVMYCTQLVLSCNMVVFHGHALWLDKSPPHCVWLACIIHSNHCHVIWSYSMAMLIGCVKVHHTVKALHASVVHASGSGQLQANPHVAGPWLSPGKPTRRAVSTMGSNDLVVGEVHMLGPSCQRYNWHTGRCGSIAFGSSPRRGKTLISNPAVLRKYPLVEKKITSRKNQEWSP